MQDLPTPSASHGSPSDSGSSSSPKDGNDMALPFDFLMHEDTLGAPSFMQSGDSAQGDWVNPGLWSQPAASEWTTWNTETNGTDSSIESSLEMLNLLNGSLDAPSALGFPTENNSQFSFSFNPAATLPPSTLAPPSLHFQTPSNGQEMTPAPSPQVVHAAIEGSRKRKVEEAELSLDGEIAMRARQSAGVHEAVSASAAVARTSQFPVGSAYDNKIPLPRLPPRPQTSSRPAIVVKQPTPPTSHYSTSPSPPAEQLPPVAPPLLTASGRIKTPHTTIERRYRTNLNARIQALKNAVPALRVVEARKTKRIEDSMDVVDSRGFVDGVKVARKSSKANVLGKAVEYIRVLKKREHRLKREADGLKTLLTGLVGGAGLLAEWERAWRDQYGGEEMDEVEGEADEASDEDDQDSEDDKPKKKLKVSATEAVPTTKKKLSPPPLPVIAPVAVAVDGLKRKRGRPRKVALPGLDQAPLQFTQQSQSATYLLATFLFFSFFKPPSNSPIPAHHQHSGSVLNPEPATMNAPPRLLGFEMTPQWMMVTETLHTLVSILLLMSIILPFLPKTPNFLRNLAIFSVSKSEETKEVGKPKPSVPDRVTVALADRTATQEINLRRALSVSANGGSLFSVLKAVAQKSWGAVAQLPPMSPSKRKGWLRLGEIEVLKGENASFFPRMHTYLTFSRCIAVDPSPAELAVAALLIGPIAPGSALAFWSQAQSLPDEQKTAIEQVALLVDFEEASNIVAEVEGSVVSPLEIIAGSIALDKIKQYVSNVFIRTVLGEELDNEVQPSSITGYKLYMEAAKDIGDKVGKIVTHVDHVVGSTSPSLSDSGISVSSDSDSESMSGGPMDDPALDSPAAKETMSILHALQLYQRLFPSINFPGSDLSNTVILSPPPSPTRRSAQTHPLRRALASPAFEGDADMEDARDRVVDLLNDLDARRRGVALRRTSS